MAGHRLRVLRVLQELHAALVFCRAWHRLFAGVARSHAARARRATARLAVPVPDRVSFRDARVGARKRAQPAVPGTAEHGRERPDDVRRGCRDVFFPLGGVRDDRGCVCPDRPAVRPNDEAAAQSPRLRPEPARQPRRRRADLRRQLPVDAADRLVRDLVCDDPAFPCSSAHDVRRWRGRCGRGPGRSWPGRSARSG